MEAIYLQSMTDFCLEILDENPPYSEVLMLTKISKYANFLKQPLQLGFFVPCDLDGNILEQPCDIMQIDGCRDCACREYLKAKERVLFKDFSIRTENKKKYVCIEGYEIEVSVLPRLKMTIEDLSNDWNHIELTDSAIKQIGL